MLKELQGATIPQSSVPQELIWFELTWRGVDSPGDSLPAQPDFIQILGEGRGRPVHISACARCAHSHEERGSKLREVWWGIIGFIIGLQELMDPLTSSFRPMQTLITLNFWEPPTKPWTFEPPSSWLLCCAWLRQNNGRVARHNGLLKGRMMGCWLWCFEGEGGCWWLWTAICAQTIVFPWWKCDFYTAWSGNRATKNVIKSPKLRLQTALRRNHI